MTIEINQSLHGYLNGHQLLACSQELSIEEQRTSTFQSDLSGANIIPGFEEYLTGYSIIGSNSFVVSKTWYAYEMPRPGCVWTHSLWIKFSDLGKIPDFRFLLSYFERPIQGEFKHYNEKVLVSWDDVISPIKSDLTEDKLYLSLVEFFYDNYNKTVVIPTKESKKYEEMVLALWSDQWPRLRRSFTFCTGALSLKVYQSKPFALQVVPSENVRLIERSNENVTVFKGQPLNSPNWSNLIKSSAHLSLRKFLWTYGADISGERQNYFPLLQLYNAITKNDLTQIHAIFQNNFPRIDEARTIKAAIFSEDSIVPGHEAKKLSLLLSPSTNYLNKDDLNPIGRIVSGIKSEQLSVDDLLRINEEVIFATPNLLETLAKYLQENHWHILPLNWKKHLISVAPQFALNRVVWEAEYDTQKELLLILRSSKQIVDFAPYLEAIVLSKSAVVYEAEKIFGNKIMEVTYKIINNKETENDVDENWFKYIVKKPNYILRDFLLNNTSAISPKFSKKFFECLEFHDLQFINLTKEIWILLYKKLLDLDDRNLRLTAATNLLSLALQNHVSGSEWIAAEVFHTVFSEAEKSQLPAGLWKHLPKKDIREEIVKEFSFTELFKGFLGLPANEKNRTAASWDYCEILIRTISSSFLYFKWSEQAFLDCLHTEKEFNRAIKYISSFYTGTWFILTLGDSIKKNKVKATRQQVKMINA